MHCSDFEKKDAVFSNSELLVSVNSVHVCTWVTSSLTQDWKWWERQSPSTIEGKRTFILEEKGWGRERERELKTENHVFCCSLCSSLKVHKKLIKTSTLKFYFIQKCLSKTTFYSSLSSFPSLTRSWCGLGEVLKGWVGLGQSAGCNCSSEAQKSLYRAVVFSKLSSASVKWWGVGFLSSFYPTLKTCS